MGSEECPQTFAARLQKDTSISIICCDHRLHDSSVRPLVRNWARLALMRGDDNFLNAVWQMLPYSLCAKDLTKSTDLRLGSLHIT
jgi:hypothetical protein